MLEPEPYILRVRYEDEDNDVYIGIHRFDVVDHRCGLSAGDKIQLLKDVVFKDIEGKPTGDMMSKGEIYTVLKGSVDDPDSLPLRNHKGEHYPWDMDDSVWEHFRRVDND